MREAGGVALLSLQGAPELRPKVVRALVQNGIDVLRIDRGAARLESIFLKLTKDDGATEPAMSATLLIARRELGGYFRTMTGYIIAGLRAAGRTACSSTRSCSAQARCTRPRCWPNFFYISFGTTCIASVFISMRLLAEERQTGTLVLLTSSPVHDWEIVLGKYPLGAGLPGHRHARRRIYMPALIFVNGKVSLGHLFAGLSRAAAASAPRRSRSASSARRWRATRCWPHLLGSHHAGHACSSHLLARVTDRPLKDVFMSLALFARHFPPFQIGAIHMRDVVYYVALTYVALFGAIRVMEARRWK